jgi:hypothetical protein
MEKYFLIQQPPITEKFRLLVEEMSENEKFGFTSDIDMIKYNINLLGSDFKKDLTIKNMFTDKGITTVFPIGSFITVLELKKDETEGKMTFFDFDIEISSIKPILKATFSENIVNQFVNIHNLFESDFSEDDDLFVLFRPNLS